MEWLNHLLKSQKPVGVKFEDPEDEVFDHNFGGLDPPDGTNRKIILGVCAVKKKASSRHMNELLKILRERYHFETLVFPEETVLYEPIEKWPRCHCLIAFFSVGFPLEKAEAYAAKYKPFLINKLRSQHLLKDRRHVFAVLEKNNIQVPEHLIMNRGTHSPSGPMFPVEANEESDLEEYDDYIVIKGKKLMKPFVEKPVDGDDHNVYIYYPRSAGGGSKRLFRKIGNKSSQFYPEENNVRRNGSYIYEKFIPTEGTDVKVYVVTGKYAHAEARKSPVVDGMVIRNASTGGEVRYPVRLGKFEKQLAVKVIAAFGQTVCGFDLLRSGKTYVCDVNGWSFVKNNEHYYADAAGLLSELMYRAMGVKNLSKHLTSETVKKRRSSTAAELKGVMEGRHEELRCVIGIIRHGDRTPKQKMKMKVDSPEFLSLFDKYKDVMDADELKLKTAAQLGDVLNATRTVLTEMMQTRTEEMEEGDLETIDKLLQMKTVLEMHGQFKGINRKVQLKPKKWKETKEGKGKVVVAQLILKWGGVLTSLGRNHAQTLGLSFRQQLYPGEDGLLRLHSTYRHDLKISSSDEGRVQVTAAAFAKGLLDLHGHLTPILASLVAKSPAINSILDDASDAKNDLEAVKNKLHPLLQADVSVNEDKSLLEKINPTLSESVANALKDLDNPYKAMVELHRNISGLVVELKGLRKDFDIKHSSGDQETQQLFNQVSGHVLLSEVDDPGVSRQARSREEHANAGGYLRVHTNEDDSQNSKNSTEVEWDQPLGTPESNPARKSTRSPSSQPDSVGIPSPIFIREKCTDAMEKANNVVSMHSEGGSAAASIMKSSNRSLLSSMDALHLGLARWTKLEKDFYNAKKNKFDLSKIPDIFDCAKYDILHSPALITSVHLDKVYKLSKSLADIVVPQEYGMTAQEKLRIGKHICKNLLNKIKNDIKISIETAMGNDEDENEIFGSIKIGEKSIEENDEDTDDDSENETSHRLDPRYAASLGIKSGSRHVRTRLYFTSESHLHSTLNTLRFASIIPESLPYTSTSKQSASRSESGRAQQENMSTPPISISAEDAAKISKAAELGYLTHIVIRLYEVFNESPEEERKLLRVNEKNKNQNHTKCRFPRRFRVSVSISDGTPVSVDEAVKIEEDQIKVKEKMIAALGGKIGLRKSLRCYPCNEMVPLWKEILANDFEHLINRVVNTDLEQL